MGKRVTVSSAVICLHWPAGQQSLCSEPAMFVLPLAQLQVDAREELEAR